MNSTLKQHSGSLSMKSWLKGIIILAFMITGGIQARSQCQANFVMYPDSSSTLTVHFQNTSSGTFTMVSWNFGDGSSSSQHSPSHTFAMGGTYNVCLTITDSLSSCYDVKCVQVTLSLGPPCKAQFQYSALPGSSTVAFANTSYAISTSFLSFWDFGDSTTSMTHSPFHTYAQGGIYQVCLIIFDLNNGCSNSFCHQVIVTSPLQCQAFFVAKLDTSVNTPNVFKFLDQSYSQTPIISWSWDFGDGSTSSIQNPTHQYLAPGPYHVCLTIQTLIGCISTHCMTLNVGASHMFHLGGQVFAGSYPVDEFNLILYRYTGFAIHSLDTFLFDTLGFYYFFQLPEGPYYMKVEPTVNSTFYGDYAPTYNGSELLWGHTSPYVHNSETFAGDIHLVPVTPLGTQGQGRISGRITGTLSPSGPFGAIKDLEILLFDPSWNVLAYTHTSAMGYYAFDSLPHGDYTIYPELAGVNTQPVTVTLSGANPQADSINFHAGAVITALETETLPNMGFHVFPNPTTEWIKIESPSQMSSSSLIIELYDVMGRIVYLSGSHSSEQTMIDLADLKAGSYILVITTKGSERQWRTKIIKQ